MSDDPEMAGVTAICDQLEGHRALHPRASREEIGHLVATVLRLSKGSADADMWRAVQGMYAKITPPGISVPTPIEEQQ